MENIADIVTKALLGSSKTYLHEIVDHGIHNLTNDYSSGTQDEYDAFADEFAAQAQELLRVTE